MATSQELKQRCKELGKDEEFINKFENSKAFYIVLEDIQNVDNIKLICWGGRVLSKYFFAVERTDCIIVMTGRQLKIYDGTWKGPDVFSIKYDSIKSYEKLASSGLWLRTSEGKGDLGNGEYHIHICGGAQKAICVLNSVLE